jgi:alanine dehydrogenase
MNIGIPKEIKTEEYRVAILPSTVSVLTEKQHRVLIEAGAGTGAGIPDREYIRAGAEIVRAAALIYRESELIVKVKEPQPAEYEFLQEGQIIFTFFHFAANAEMTEVLKQKKVNCIAYELVEENGSFPLLKPMSEIAGKLAPQQVAKYLEKEYGGKGILLSGASGVKKGKIVIIGGGVVGFSAAEIALGMGAEVVILEKNPGRKEILQKELPECRVLQSSPEVIKDQIKNADGVIGAVMIAGKRAPVVIEKEDLQSMEEGTVLVDVAIDQGGCFCTSRVTNHKQPVFTEDGIVHYCVANLPGIVPRTSAFALSRVTEPYVLLLADSGLKATETNLPLKYGLALKEGKIVSEKL